LGTAVNQFARGKSWGIITRVFRRSGGGWSRGAPEKENTPAKRRGKKRLKKSRSIHSQKGLTRTPCNGLLGQLVGGTEGGGGRKFLDGLWKITALEEKGRFQKKKAGRSWGSFRGRS